jgi:hypothetical protein
MIKDVYYSKKNNIYYYLGLMPCEKCRELISKLIFIERVYSNNNKTTRYFCKSCVSKRQILPHKYLDMIMCLVVDSLPSDAFPVFDSPPGLAKVNSEDNLSIAHKNVSGEKIIDRAFQTHNSNFMIMSDVKSEHELIDDIKRKDAKISMEKIDSVFEKIKTYDLVDGSRFALEEIEEKKRIEVHK